MGADNVFITEDGGATWSAIVGQRNDFIPHHGMSLDPGKTSGELTVTYIGVLSPAEDALYIPYANGVGPWDGTAGYISKYFIGNGTWVDVTPAQGIADNSYGYSGLSVDLNNPGTVVVAPFNEWYPDAK